MNARPLVVCAALICLAVASVAEAAAPEHPTTVRTKRLSPTEVRVTWKDNSSNEAGFEILRRQPPERDFVSRGTVGANVREFFDEADKGNLYVYRVVAFNDDGASRLSHECFVGRTPPAVPINFKVRLIALTVIRVSWSDRSSTETGFLIQRRSPGKGFQTVTVVPPNTKVFDDTGLDRNETYTYRVRALGRPARCISHSKFSVERSATTRAGLKVLTIDRLGGGKGRVTSSPSGISCGPDADHCSAVFPIGTEVTLTARPNNGSRFATWVDVPACERSEAPCTFNMGRDREVGAIFRKIPNR